MAKKSKHLTPAQKIDLKNVAIFDHYLNRGEFDFEALSEESEALVGTSVSASYLERLARDEAWLRDASQVQASTEAQAAKRLQAMAARSRADVVEESLSATSLVKQAALSQLSMMTHALTILTNAVQAIDDPNATEEERKKARAQAYDLLPGDWREIMQIIKDSYGMIESTHAAELELADELEAIRSQGPASESASIGKKLSQLPEESLGKLFRTIELMQLKELQKESDADQEKEDLIEFDIDIEDEEE